jgi:hypothetical protein
MRSSATAPRICCPSWRKFRQVVFQGAVYEAQDVLAEIDDVDLLCPEARWLHAVRDELQKKLVWVDLTRTVPRLNPGLTTLRLRRTYDLFIAFCQNWTDLLALNAIKGWERKCGTSLCWIDEMWGDWVPRYRNWIHLLDRFDHIAVTFKGSVGAVEKALGRPCHWLPHAVDALRFTPYPNPPARVIDVYSIGRRWEGSHRALLEASSRSELLYIFDSIRLSDSSAPDHREHRRLVASLAKRSRFFLVAPAKMNALEERGGQSELGSRYYEGAAAGAVLIGRAPANDSFRELFGWPDAVIEIEPDGSNVVDLIADLSRDPGRLQAISRRNAGEALSRHDWSYRWESVLSMAGLAPLAALAERKERLSALAGTGRG